MESKNYDLNNLKINRSSGTKGEFYKSAKFIVPFIIVLGGVFLIFLFFNPFSSVVEVKSSVVSKISHSQSSAVLTASGYVVAQRKAAVASKGMGRLVYLGVVEGDEVSKDAVIARLEDSDIKAQLEQAKANLKLSNADLKEAENNFDRQKKLYATNSTTKPELDAAETRLLRVQANIEVAAAMVKNSEVALENTLIRAPFKGKVLTKNADVGEVIAPMAGSVSSRGAVVTIADMASLQVEADVSESNIQKIKINQECEITLDAYQSFKYPGFVSKIVPTADRSKATIQVKIGFKKYDEKVFPEMSAKVLFLGNQPKDKIEEQKAMLVAPSSAVVSLNGKKYIYKIVNNSAVETEIITGVITGTYIEIISGINEGDKIIEAVTPNIKNGTQLKVL